MTDLELMKHAKDYIDAMANGKNPLTGEIAAEGDVINNVRISRCLFYVSSILEKNIKREQRSEVRAIRRAIKKEQPKDADLIQEPFSFTQEQIAQFNYTDSTVSISETAKKINELINFYCHEKITQKMTYKMIEDLLVKSNMLVVEIDGGGRRKRYPTQKGENIGISMCQRVTDTGKVSEYPLLNRDAQKFILDNI